MPKILGVPDRQYAQPLWLRLREKPEFSVQVDTPAQLAIRLRQHTIQAAVLSPIDYARDYAMYRIVPHVAISSKGESKTIFLKFTKGLHSIKTIAVDPRSASEIVLARLVLAEKYDIQPTFVPCADTLNTGSLRTDAALIGGDQTSHIRGESAIDLVDEWTDMTGLPFVHRTWVSREDDLTVAEMELLIAAPRNPAAGEDRGVFRYGLDEEVTEGLAEFLRMAYYHGVVNDIPDVKLHSMEAGTDIEDGNALPAN